MEGQNIYQPLMYYNRAPRQRRREAGPYVDTYEACHDVPVYAEGRPSSYVMLADAGDHDPPMTSLPMPPAEGDAQQRAAAKDYWARTSHSWFGNECWTTHEEAPDEWFRWNDVKNQWDIFHGPAWAEVIRQLQPAWLGSVGRRAPSLRRSEDSGPDMEDQCRQGVGQKLDAETYLRGAKAVYGQEEAMTEKEQQIRWVHSIFEEVASDCQLYRWGLPMDLLLLLLGVCLTQIGQQRMIDNPEEEEAPPDKEVTYREARVLFSVLNEAKIKLGRSQFMDCRRARQAKLFLQALLERCSLLIGEETLETREESGEKQQVRALWWVLDAAVEDQNELDRGDVEMLLQLLRSLCEDILRDLGREVDIERRREVRNRLWFQAPSLIQSSCFTADLP
jgi:hypothetical protein